MAATGEERRCGPRFGARARSLATGERSAAASCPRRSVDPTNAMKISEQAASRRQQLLPAIKNHLGTNGNECLLGRNLGNRYHLKRRLAVVM